MRRIAGPLAIVLLVPAAVAQDDRAAPRFGSQTELIQIDVRVTGKGGQHVRDLRREDFVLLEDGKPQAITHFVRRAPRGIGDATLTTSTESAGAGVPLPDLDSEGRLLVLAVDTQSLDATTFLNIKQRMLEFVEGQMGPDDKAALVTTSGLMLQPFTSDRDLLRQGVRRIRAADMKATPFAERPHMSTYQADLILRNDTDARLDYRFRLLQEDKDLPPQMVEMITNTRARRIMAEAARTSRNTLGVMEELIRPLADFPARKILVLFSNGLFTREEERTILRRVTAAAARAGVVIYALDSRGLTVSSPAGPITDASVGGRPSIIRGTLNYSWLGFEADRSGLNMLAKETGGLPLFDADISTSLKRMLVDSEAGYVLGYEPTWPPGDERYHKIEVKVPGRSGLEIRAQRGYLGRGAAGKRVASKKDAPAPPPGPRDPLRDALISLMPRQELPVDLAAGYADTEAGPTIVITARVAPAPGETAPAPRKVELLGVIYDEEGLPLANFKDALEGTAQDRLTFDTHTTVAPGRYQVRAAVSDGKRFGTAALWTEVPDVKLGTFTLTDVFAIEGDAPPRPVRSGQVFSRKVPVEFTLFACNPKGDSGRHADVSFGAALLSGERVVTEDPPFEVTVQASEPRPPRVGFSRSFPLAALDPGPYALRIHVADRIAGTTEVREVAFRVE